jgi:nicotinamide riboside kinase
MGTVINLLGGPSSGKSVTAALLFAKMKLAGYKVELVTEYAKDLVYADRKSVLETNQLYILAKQNYRLVNTIGKVDYIITDTCLLLSNVYPEFYGQYLTDAFREVVQETFSCYINLNFFIDRPSHFEEYGRTQNLEESKRLDQMIMDELENSGNTFLRVKADDKTVDTILQSIKEYEVDSLANH